VKSLISIILITSIISFQFSELVLYVTFKINQGFIAENICVEKDVEGSTCKGCCHLNKKMNEQHEQKKELPPIQDNKQNIDFCKYNQEIELLIYFKCFDLPFKESKVYQFQINNSVFHPPRQLF